MGHPGAAQLATALRERNHLHLKVMPSSWPALLLNCADGLSAQPSTGRATLTFTWAGANAAGAGAATIFLTSAAPSTSAALSLARRLGGRRAACARLRAAPEGARRASEFAAANSADESAGRVSGRSRPVLGC